MTDTLSGEWTRFAYDADGQRVKREDASGVTYYQGDWFELSLPATTTLQLTSSVGVPFNGLPWTSWPVGARVRTYYYLGAQRVALRDTTATGTGVTFLHGDHLGSASLATDVASNKVGELRYMPFGQERGGFAGLPTDRTFTGQRRDAKISLHSPYASAIIRLFVKFGANGPSRFVRS